MRKTISAAAIFFNVAILMAGNLLFDNGRTDWQIYIPSSAGISRTTGSTRDNAVFSYAAEELQVALKKISGIDFPIIKSDSPPSNNAIVLGTIDSSRLIKKLAQKLKLKQANIEHIAVYTLNGNLYLAGNNPRACLYAVYSFLQNQLGVRWFWPGDDGEFITPMNRYTLPALAYNYTPSFRFREMTPCSYHNHVPTEVWLARNFCNGGSRTHKIRDKVGFYRLDGCHWVSISKAAEEFKKRPEMFSEIKGERVKSGTAGCWSSPEFLKYTVKKHKELINSHKYDILNTFPSDHNIRCECADCIKNPDRTLRWFDFYAKLRNELKKIYPKLMFAGIAYQEYRNVPTKPIKGLEYIEYCQYNRCYVHKLDNPDCKHNKKSLAELKRWQAKANMGIYGYEFDIFKPTMYVPFWNMLADEMKVYHDLGLVRMKTELTVYYHKNINGKHTKIIRSKIPQQRNRLSNYMYCQLMWNAEAKTADFLNDWCKKVFDPAAKPMLTYHKMMAQNWDNLKLHRSYFSANPTSTAQEYINPVVIKEANQHFKEATALAETVKAPKRRDQILSEIAVNKEFFVDWVNYYQRSRTDTMIINVPYHEEGTNAAFKNAARVSFQTKDKKRQEDITGFIYWSDKALHIKIVYPEQNTVDLKAEKDNPEIFNNENIEIFIDPMDGSTYRHFAFNSAGAIFDARQKDRNWNSGWTVRNSVINNKSIADITIPFSTLNHTPKLKEQWQIIINCNRKPEASGFPVPLDDITSGAVIYFGKKLDPKKKLTWFVKKKSGGMIPYLFSRGWDYKCENGKDALTADLSARNMIVITTNSCGIPKEFYEKKLPELVRNGAVVVFNNYGYTAYHKWFKDDVFKMRFTERLHQLRRTINIAKDSFATTPNDMKRVLGHTPPGAYIVEHPEEWRTLATQLVYLTKDRTKAPEERPYLLARPYGKGLVVVTGLIGYAKDGENVVKQLENLLVYNDTIDRTKFNKQKNNHKEKTQ